MVYKKATVFMDQSLSDLLEEFKHKNKIVVFCSGPSAKKATIEKNALYLVTNDGYRRMLNEDIEYLLYLNDQYTVRRILANNSIYKKNQKVLFFYSSSILHQDGWRYLENKVHLLKEKSLFFLLDNKRYPKARQNFLEFEQFYHKENLEVKIQNSGMFLLLFGYYLAKELELPMEIYGLDLGLGGNYYFDSKTSPGKSVTRDRVKVNVKMYLDHIYTNHFEVKNFSNFYGNETGFCLQENNRV